MSLAVSQNMKSYQAIGGMPLLLDAHLDDAETLALSSFAQPVSTHNQFAFRSKVTVEGSSVYLPEQSFTLRFSPTQMEIESHPVNGWPKIYLSFNTNEAGNYQIKQAKVIDSELSTQAKIKDTRFRFAIAEKSKFTIYIPEFCPLPIKFSLSQEWINNNRTYAEKGG